MDLSNATMGPQLGCSVMRNLAYDKEFNIIFCLTHDSSFNFETSVTSFGGKAVIIPRYSLPPPSNCYLLPQQQEYITSGDPLSPGFWLVF
jgi:hypothetical protein